MPAAYEQFFLFGDSITEQSFNQERGFGFSAALASAYIRRLDVINRGFSGYNSRQALKVLPHIIPSPEEARIRFFVVFFGANDASVPEAQNNQHVPLDEYKENLEKIITDPRVTAHEARILLVTVPPINEHLQWITDQSKGLKVVSRQAPTTKRYADAVCEVAEKHGAAVINLWKAFMTRAGFKADAWKTGDPIPGAIGIPQNDVLVELMHDGLHFNPAGYDIFFKETMKVISKKWPDQMPERLPTVFPGWNDAGAWETFEKAN